MGDASDLTLTLDPTATPLLPPPNLGVGPLTDPLPNAPASVALNQIVSSCDWWDFQCKGTQPGASFLNTYGVPIMIGIGAWLLLKG